MNAAVIQHSGTGATLTADDPRPLMQAAEGIAQEYGWALDFEDPPYRSNLDLVDDTDPAWRASHPNTRGVTRVSGGLFQSSFPEPSSIALGDAEEQVLQKLVSDYNSSGNPGKFVVRRETEGRFAVIGVSRRNETGKDEPVNVLLDTRISVTAQKRDARATLQLILATLSAETGVKVILGMTGLSSDPLRDAEITIGGTNVSARTLLLQALDSVSSTSPHFRGIFLWNLLFDADTNSYWLHLRPATKMESGPYGKQVVGFVERPRN